MKLIFVFFIVKSVASQNRCSSRESCVFDLDPLDLINFCFKPVASFRNFKIAGFPNYNYNLHLDEAFDILKTDSTHYVTIAVDRTKVDEWNRLQLHCDEESYDIDTRLRRFTYTLNGKESKFTVLRYIGNGANLNDFYSNYIHLSLEGEWEGSTNFSVSVVVKENINFSKKGTDEEEYDDYNGEEYEERIKKYFHYSNCDGIKISNNSKDSNGSVSNESASNESALNQFGLLVGCVSGSIVGLIFMLTILIYVKVKRSRVAKESVYYEQYPEEYEHVEIPQPSLGYKVDLHDKVKRSGSEELESNYYEQFPEDYELNSSPSHLASTSFQIVKPENVTEGFETNQEDEGGAETNQVDEGRLETNQVDERGLETNQVDESGIETTKEGINGMNELLPKVDISGTSNSEYEEELNIEVLNSFEMRL